MKNAPPGMDRVIASREKIELCIKLGHVDGDGCAIGLHDVSFGLEVGRIVSGRSGPPCAECGIPRGVFLTSARKEVEVGWSYIGA